MSKLLFTLFLLISSQSALGNPSTFSILKTDPRTKGDEANNFVMLSPTGSVEDRNGWMTRQRTFVKKKIDLKSLTPQTFFSLWAGVIGATDMGNRLQVRFQETGFGSRGRSFTLPLRILSQNDEDRFECHWEIDSDENFYKTISEFEGSLILEHIEDGTLVKFTHTQTHHLRRVPPSILRLKIDEAVRGIDPFLEDLINKLEAL